MLVVRHTGNTDENATQRVDLRAKNERAVAGVERGGGGGH